MRSAFGSEETDGTSVPSQSQVEWTDLRIVCNSHDRSHFGIYERDRQMRISSFCKFLKRGSPPPGSNGDLLITNDPL